MKRVHQFLRFSLTLLLSFLMIFSPFTTLAAEINQVQDNKDTVSSELPNVNVRVESLNYTITQPTKIETGSFDLAPYVGGSSSILPDSPRVIHAIIRALEESGIDTTNKEQFNLGFGGNYIRAIDGLAEFDAGMLSGWMYYVDHEYAPVGVLDYELKDGQDIVVFYVQNFMENIYSYFEQEKYVTKANEPITVTLKGSFFDQYTNVTEDVLVNDATILVNDKPIEIDGSVVMTNENGRAELTFTEPGTYHISATKKNSNNEQIISRPYAKVVVEEEIIDDIPPIISVNGLWDGMVVHETELSFKVQAIDDVDGKVDASVTFNNVEVAPSDEDTYTITLNEGENVVLVSAVDSSGNEAVKTFTVLYEKEVLKDPIDVQEAIDLASDYILDKGVTSEWEAIGIAQAGKEISRNYYHIFKQNVEDQITKALKSGRIKITDIERLAMASTVIGEDPRNVFGHNLIELIYNSPDHLSGADTMTFQGNNGPIFALIALDTLNFEVPENARWTRQDLIDELLNNQNEDGSWHLSDLFESPSIDITAMAMIALSKYKDQPEVDTALTKTVNYLSSVQTDNGGFDGGSVVGGVTSEAASQAIIGLTAYGIDPTSELFTKDKNLIEHLLAYQNKDGGFSHTLGDSRSNDMATEQALQGLVAYHYFVTEKGPLYDFTNQEYSSIKPKDPIEVDVDEDKPSVVEVVAGDEIKVSNSGTSVVLPESIPADTKLVITQVNDESLLKNINLAGDIFDFTFLFPEGSEAPTGSYVLTMGINDGVDETKVAIYYFNEETGTWEFVGGEVKDGKITTEVDHFSTYAVLTDTEAPTNIQLSAENVDNKKVVLSFSAEDFSGIDHFILLRNGEKISQVDGKETNFIDADITAGVSYEYQVIAVDLLGNEGKSTPVTVEIPKTKTDEPITEEEKETTEETGTTGDEKDETGKVLPKTATNMYNYLVGGLLLFILGSALIVYYKRKQLS